MLPAASNARTRKVCLPRLSLRAKGEVQLTNGCLSIWHWKPPEPTSLELKLNLTRLRRFLERTLFLGPAVMVVWGACVSIVKEREPGVASTLPPGSRAVTVTECKPSLSEGVVKGPLPQLR